MGVQIWFKNGETDVFDDSHEERSEVSWKYQVLPDHTLRIDQLRWTAHPEDPGQMPDVRCREHKRFPADAWQAVREF